MEQLTEEDAIIAVMGSSGAGKTSFINMATGSKEPTSDLESCTRDIRIVKFSFLDVGKLDVILVDTPGFNHENMSDAEVLAVIANWLKAVYEHGIKLIGIVYLQNLGPMAGMHRRNNMMFERLCGKVALQNVVIATTVRSRFEAAHQSLWENDLAKGWEAMLAYGTTSCRYLDTKESAWDILGGLLKRKSRYAIRLQIEMVDLGLQLHETSAGRAWNIQSETISRPKLHARKSTFDNLSKRQSIDSFGAKMHTVKSVVEINKLSEDDMVIALMGPAGMGKNSFVKMVAADGLDDLHNLESCTTIIRTVKVGDMVLVDIPAFENAWKRDAEIWNMTINWLIDTYKRGIKLAGILYFHRITDNRVTGASLKNIRILEKLCGRKALPNIILVTTMWDNVDPKIGLERENDLKRGCWKSMIKQGSRAVRCRNTYDSAWAILNIPLVRDLSLPLLIQQEIVDIGKQIGETEAGRELYLHRGANQAGSDDEYSNAQLQTINVGTKPLIMSMGKRFLRYTTSFK